MSHASVEQSIDISHIFHNALGSRANIQTFDLIAKIRHTWVKGLEYLNPI